MKTEIRSFGGIDERIQTENSPSSAKNIKNFRIQSDGSLKKRPSLKEILDIGGRINGIWRGIIADTEQFLAVADDKVYRIIGGMDREPEFLGTAVDRECRIFRFGDNVYIKAVGYYAKYDGYVLTPVEGYIPTLATNCLPNGEGRIYEQINMITPKRKQKFSCDGEATVYNLCEKNIKTIEHIKIDGEAVTTGYTADLVGGKITFGTAPTAGINNLEICYSVNEIERTKIFGCTELFVFGGNSDSRIFLWGNGAYPNYRFFSELTEGVASAEYFPIGNYTVIGSGSINCISQQYGKQIIFTDERAYYSPCELITDALGHNYSSFPVYDLNGSKGCIIKMGSCIADGRPITFCDDGFNRWEQTSVENERNAICFSHEIEGSVKEMMPGVTANIPKVFDFQAMSELYIIFGDTAYIYNYKSRKWYTFDGFYCESYFVYGETLFLGKDGKIFVFSDRNEEYGGVAFWESNKFNLSESGTGDVTALYIDHNTEGETEISFKTPSGETKTRFGGAGREKRIFLRPRIKRSAPIALKIKCGDGKGVISGVTMVTRERKRGERFGTI